MLKVDVRIYWILVMLFDCGTCRTSPTTASTAVIIYSEGVSCLPRGRSTWSVTCIVIIPEGTYAMSVHVTALDRFNDQSIIATCSEDTYTFSSFAQFMGQTGRACLLPKENHKNQFNVSFLFTHAAVDSEGLLSVPFRNISCSAAVYSSTMGYKLHKENSTQDLLQCVSPQMELPPTFHFFDGDMAVLTCSALHGTPEANILLRVTPAASQSSISVTGMKTVFININASSVYHRASVNCTVLNHAHYLHPRTSEILVYYISPKKSILQPSSIDTTSGITVNCSDIVESYPDAEYEWFMDDEVVGRAPVFWVSPLSTGELKCSARNTYVNVTVSVTYTLDYQQYVKFAFALSLIILIIPFIVWQKQRPIRETPVRRSEADGVPFTTELEYLNLENRVQLNEGVPYA